MKIVNGTFNNCTFTVNDESQSAELLKIKERASNEQFKAGMQLGETLVKVAGGIMEARAKAQAESKAEPARPVKKKTAKKKPVAKKSTSKTK